MNRTSLIAGIMVLVFLMSVTAYCQTTPKIYSISPDAAENNQLVYVTINGSNFQDGATVELVSPGKADIVVVFATLTGYSLYCQLDLTDTEPGVRDLIVTNPDGESAVLNNAFTVINAPPSVYGCYPTSCYNYEIADVEISGSNFQDDLTAKLVDINGTEITATNMVTSSSAGIDYIQCKFDMRNTKSGGYNLVVTNPDGQAAIRYSAFTVYSAPAPSISSVSPDIGHTDNSSLSLTLDGLWFVDGCTVALQREGQPDIIATDVAIIDLYTITCNVDLTGVQPGDWRLVVTNPQGLSSDVYGPTLFSVYAPPPVIDSITPSFASQTTPATITVQGNYFQEGCSVILYNNTYGCYLDVENTTYNSPTQITFDIQPEYAATGPYSVIVTNSDWQSTTLPDALTLLPPPPSIDYVSPYMFYNSRPLTDARIGGVSFVDGMSVKFTKQGQADIIAEVTEIYSDYYNDEIYFNIDLTGAEPGWWDVVVTDPYGRSCTQPEGFIINHIETPALTSISPNSGTYFDRNLEVTLTGTGFYEESLLLLMRDGEEFYREYTYSNSSETAYSILNLSALQAGIYDVVIENPDGQQAIITGGFTVNTPPPPTITSISPNISTGVAANFHMTITGSDFSEYVEIALVRGEQTLRTYNIIIPGSDTIECVWNFNNHEPGKWDVVVTNQDGQSATLPEAFELLSPAPQITGMTPSVGLQGTVLEVTALTGNYFQPGARVKLIREEHSDIEATNIIVVNSNRIKCTLDLTDAAIGGWSLRVTNPDGQFTEEDGFAVSTGYTPDVVGQWGGSPTRTVVSGGYAYLGVGPRLIALDAAEDGGPITSPEYNCVGKSSILPGRVLSLAVYGNYAFIAADQAGLQIIDITDPTQMVHVGGIDTPGTARDIAISGDRAYVADYPTGLLVFDISVPTSPTLLGELNREDVLSVAVRGQVACVGTGYAYYIVDVSNPADPVVASNFPVYDNEEPPLPDPAISSTQSTAQPIVTETGFEYMPSKIVESNGYFFIAQQSGLYIVDISDEGYADLVYNYSMPIVSVATAGNRMYIALPWEPDIWGSDYRSVLQFDITDPANPVEYGNLYVYDTGAVTDAYAIGQRLYLVSNTKYTMLDDSQGSPRMRSYYDWGQPVSAGITDNHMAYILDGATGAGCVDVSNPAWPVMQSGYHFMDFITYERCLTVAGDTAYTSGPNNGFEVHDISNPVSPTGAGNCAVSGDVKAIAVTDDYYAYVASDGYGLDVVDVLDPVVPVRVGGYPTFGGRANGVAVSGNYVFLAIGENGLQTMDISVPYIPVRKGLCDTPGTARDVVVSGNYAYIADGEAGLQVIDISKPALPALVSSCVTYGDACDVELQGNYAWVVNRMDGVILIDLSTPASPQVVAWYDTVGSIASITVRDGLAYVSDREGGLLILSLPDAPAITSITPNRAKAITSTGTIVIDGANFQPGANVKLTRNGQPDISAASVFIVSPGRITCTFSLPQGSEGTWNVVVTNPDGKSAIRAKAFYIDSGIDTASPAISAVYVNPSRVCKGDLVRITVDVVDNDTVTAVTAGGIAMTCTGGNTWKCYIPASEEIGDHAIEVIASDTNGNTATDSSASYKTCPNVGINIRDITTPLATSVAGECAFTVWGTVVSVVDDRVTINDGSPENAVVIMPGSHSYQQGDFITARGWLVQSSPVTIEATTARLISSH